MDRRLVVLRHAQARSGNPGQIDHERRLTDRGRRDARRMAEQIVELGWLPDRVVCSDSARTTETWSRMSDRLVHPRPIEVLTTPRLYGAGLEGFSGVIAEQPDAVRVVLAIGHNPGWEEVVAGLTGVIVTLGTASAALLCRDAAPGWRDALDAGSWRLMDVVLPKDPHG